MAIWPYGGALLALEEGGKRPSSKPTLKKKMLLDRACGHGDMATQIFPSRL